MVVGRSPIVMRPRGREHGIDDRDGTLLLQRPPQAPVTELGRSVSTLLVFRPGQPICAGCAARVLGVASKAVHEAMVKLEARPRMRRGYGVCDTCGKTDSTRSR